MTFQSRNARHNYDLIKFCCLGDYSATLVVDRAKTGPSNKLRETLFRHWHWLITARRKLEFRLQIKNVKKPKPTGDKNFLDMTQRGTWYMVQYKCTLLPYFLGSWPPQGPVPTPQFSCTFGRNLFSSRRSPTNIYIIQILVTRRFQPCMINYERPLCRITIRL